MLLSVGVMLPLATDWSAASRPQARKKHKKIKKYSRAWWRQYRAKQRRQREVAMRKRAAASRRAALAKTRETNGNANQTPAVTIAQYVPALGNNAPENWKGQVAPTGNGELQFNVSDQGGQQIGSAQLAVVGPAMPGADDNSSERARNKTLGGVPVSALRRTVIDRMIREQGWVVNDYQREVGGKRVFVVAAQTPGNGGVNARLFYFTEVDGRIYSLSTNSANDFTEKVAADSEKVLSAMHRNSQPTQQATNELR